MNIIDQGSARVQMGILLEPLDELLHAHPLGDLDAVHLEDVLLARARLNEAVIAVGTDIGLLPRVDLQHIHQSSPKSFNDLRLSSL